MDSGTPGRSQSATKSSLSSKRHCARRSVCEKLHSQVRDHFFEVPWRRIAGMRNIAAHANDEVNDEIVWDPLAAFVPQLVSNLGLPTDPGSPIALPPELALP